MSTTWPSTTAISNGVSRWRQTEDSVASSFAPRCDQSRGRRPCPASSLLLDRRLRHLRHPAIDPCRDQMPDRHRPDAEQDGGRDIDAGPYRGARAQQVECLKAEGGKGGVAAAEADHHE